MRILHISTGQEDHVLDSLQHRVSASASAQKPSQLLAPPSTVSVAPLTIWPFMFEILNRFVLLEGAWSPKYLVHKAEM